jgi:hypothetical protein
MTYRVTPFVLIAPVALTITLTACAPAPRYSPEPEPPRPIAGVDPVSGVLVDVTPGLNEREPDTCKAFQHTALLGQPASVVQAAQIGKPKRIVAPGSIISQEEYDSFRVNFYLDQTGKVIRINCG